MRVNYEKCLLNSNILSVAMVGFLVTRQPPSPLLSFPSLPLRLSAIVLLQLRQRVYFPCSHWHCGTVSNDNYARTMIKLIMTSNAIVRRADIICELLTSDTHTYTHMYTWPQEGSIIWHHQLTPSICQLTRACLICKCKIHLKVHSTLVLNSCSLRFGI